MLTKQRGFNKAPFSRIVTVYTEIDLSVVYPIHIDTEFEIVYLINQIVLEQKRYVKGFNRQGFNRISTALYAEKEFSIVYPIHTEKELSIVYDLQFAEVELVIHYEIASFYKTLEIYYPIHTEKELSIVYDISGAEIDLSLLYRIKTEKELSIKYPISQAEIDLSILYPIYTGTMTDIVFGGVILPGAKPDGYEDYDPTVNERIIWDGTVALAGSKKLKYEVLFYCAAPGVTEFEAFKAMIGGYYTLWVRGYRYRNCMISTFKKRNLGKTSAVEFIIGFKQDTSKERGT